MTGSQGVTATTYPLSLAASGIATSPQAVIPNDGSGNLLLAVKVDAANNDWYLQWNSWLNLSITTFQYVQIDFVSVFAGAAAANWTNCRQDGGSAIGDPNSSATAPGAVALPASPFSVVIDLTNGGTNTTGALGWGRATWSGFAWISSVVNLPDPQVPITGGNNPVIDPSSDLGPNNSDAVQISCDAIQDLALPANAFAGIGSDATWDFSTTGPPPVGLT